MNELVSRLRNFEDNFTERKLEGARPEELRRTLVAFANSLPEGRTAVLYIGVTETAELKGVKNPDSLQRKIRILCEHDCFPPIKYSCEVLNVEGNNIVAVEVLHDRNSPHFAGPAYIRQGSESVLASEKAFDDLITRRLDKIYEILKWKDKVVTVNAIGTQIQ